MIFLNSITRRRLELELCELQKDEEIVRKEVEETASDGDFRENEPFQLAKQKFTQISTRIREITTLLEEKVQDPIGSSLSVGKLLLITNLGLMDEKGILVQPEHEEMILMLDEVGDPVVDGVLSTDSDLGRIVKDGREGRYTVSTGDYYRLYDVKLYTGDAEEYFKRFPVSKKEKIDSLLAGIFY